MSPAMNHRLPRPNRAFTPRTRAFTLVEMLIVIAIISVLAALLLPAVNMAREMARKAQCGNNLKNLGLAVMQFDSAKGKFPASRTYWNDPAYKASTNHPPTSGTTSPPPFTLSWVHEIMPYIERQDMRGQIEIGLKSSPQVPVYMTSGRLNIVLCPSDETDDSVSDRIALNGAQIPYSQLSYGCNNGVADSITFTPVMLASGFDWPANGLFDNRLKGSSSGEAALKVRNTTLGDVTAGDGATNTIMFAENSDLEEWNDPRSEFHVGIVWDDDYLANGPRQLLNKYPPLTPPDTKPGKLYDIYGLPNNPVADRVLPYARPLSQHPTGFMMAFCDGRTKFVSEAIAYGVYARLMTSHGSKYMPAGANQTTTAVQTMRQNLMAPIADENF